MKKESTFGTRCSGKKGNTWRRKIYCMLKRPNSSRTFNKDIIKCILGYHYRIQVPIMCAVYSLGLWKGHCHARGTFLLSLIMKVVQSGTAAWPGLVSSASEQRLPGADSTTTQQHWDINTTTKPQHNTTMDTRSKGSPARMVSAGELLHYCEVLHRYPLGSSEK